MLNTKVDPRAVLNDFFNEFLTHYKTKTILVLSISNFGLYSDLGNSIKVTGLDWGKDIDTNFDLVLCDLPFGPKKVLIDDDTKTKFPENWKYLVQALSYIGNNGIAFFNVEPRILHGKNGIEFIKYLEMKGYFINSVLNPPEKILHPTTSFRPILIGIQRISNKEYFIGEIGNESIPALSENLYKRVDLGNLEQGHLVKKELFESFEKFKIDKQILNLKTQYKNYEKYTLKSICKNINLTRTSFEAVQNSIYLPKIGSSAVTSKIENIKIKHQNIFQITLDEAFVQSEYLSLFFKSEIGRMTLRSLNTGSFIPNITKASIENCVVAVPTLDEQQILVHTNNKLRELQLTINDLKNELSLNPQNAGIILDQFDSMSKFLKEMTKEDEILGIIRKGEGKKIEFKQTFSKNIRTGKSDKEIQKSALKNVVGFLNADGGCLLVGVTDEGMITGIKDDFYKSDDKYLNKFKDILKSKIGVEFFSFIEYNIFTVMGKKVLKIDCKPSKDPCFYEEVEFYVRSNPATDRLEGKKQMEYIRRHFG